MREKIKATLTPEFMEALKKQGCYMCSQIHTPEYLKSMAFRNDHNLWDNLDDVQAILKDENWTWGRNIDCKYLNVRIDMRDGGCLIEAASSSHSKPRRISPKQLRWQYSEATPDPVPDSEAYGE
jgi:hypothetical protein